MATLEDLEFLAGALARARRPTEDVSRSFQIMVNDRISRAARRSLTPLSTQQLPDVD